MKIAVLSSHTPSLFWFRIDMMKSFLDRGMKSLCLEMSQKQIGKKFSSLGITYRHIDVQHNGTNPIKDLKCISSIKRVLSEIMPDKIFTYQAKTVI